MKKLLLLYILVSILFIDINKVCAQSAGFFLNDWEPKSISIGNFNEYSKPQENAGAIVNINPDSEITKVSKYLFGNNANTYMTQMVDQPVLIEHISNLSPNLIRFPGGNLSNIFYWDMEPGEYFEDLPSELVDGTDGSIDDAFYWSGKNTQGWTLTLDNYYKMLEMTGNTGIITANYSYARYGLSDDPVQTAAEYAADWVRYDSGRTTYWEIGNENGGPWQAGWQINTENNKDGQPEIINGGIYGKHFVVFAEAMRQAAAEIGHEIYIGAQLVQYDAENSWNPVDEDWNELYFEAAGNTADFYIVHTYYTPYNQNSTVETILNSSRIETESIIDWLKTSTSRAGVELKPVALTEWNTSAVGSMQAVSHINGMHAAMTTGELIVNKYGEASRWDFANGWSNGDDHGMFNIGDEPDNVPLWNPRPDFYHLYYLQKYFGDIAVNSNTAGNANIQSYASKFTSGQTAVVVANKGRTDEIVQLTFENFVPGTKYYWYTLVGGDDNGDFSRKVFINGYGTEFDAGGPSNYQTIPARSANSEGGVKIEVPALSVTHLIIDEGTGGSNAAPLANISAEPLSGDVPLIVNFSAEGSSDPDGDTINYLWDFGDGTNAMGITATHTYNTAGEYKATVTVFDGSNIGQASTEVSVVAEGATCDSPTIALLPIEQDGGGENCWVIYGNVTSVNSWGMWAVYINGIDFTNAYSDNIPDAINGKYYVYINAGESWSHVEIGGTNSSDADTYYTLSTSVDGQGSISQSQSGSLFLENSEIILTAVPDEGWSFSEWSGDFINATNPAMIAMDSDKNITAVFTENNEATYNITTNVIGKGVIALSAEGPYYAGDEIVVAAIPDTNYKFDSWSGGISGTENPIPIIINSDLSITANFLNDSIEYAGIDVLISGNGKVELNPAGGIYPIGTAVEITAIPDAEFAFSNWEGDVSSVENPIQVYLDTDKELTAYFIPVEIPCDNFIITGLPFIIDGANNQCYVTSDEIVYVNSWNAEKVIINGKDYTNTWSNEFPDKINGEYYIFHEALYSWSHLELASLKEAHNLTDISSNVLSLFPNPFNQTINIRIANPENVVELSIIDSEGREIERIYGQNISQELNIGADFSQGIYILRIINRDGIESFIITKTN